LVSGVLLLFCQGAHVDSGFYAACAGLRAQSQALEVAAHNLANLNTPGYASSQVDQRKVGRLAMAIQVAFQDLGVFKTSSTQVPVAMEEPMPFATVQAIENIKRTTNLGHIVSRPEGGPGAAGAVNGDLSQLQKELEAALSNEIARKEISMRREPDGMVISLREIGFFESGSAEMKPESELALDRIAVLLRERNLRIRIEGHTDNIPIHTPRFSSNWELSTARATEVIRLLIVRDGFNPNYLSAGGYAEFHPVAGNQTVEGRGMNRRVDIVILGPGQAAEPGLPNVDTEQTSPPPHS
jgi:chemotaxis protein MotB